MPKVEWLEHYGTWHLVVHRKRKRDLVAATVCGNGVWHTWDKHGVGGENSNEDSVARAKVEAAASAIAQGFI